MLDRGTLCPFAARGVPAPEAYAHPAAVAKGTRAIVRRPLVIDRPRKVRKGEKYVEFNRLQVSL